ncbi:polysaccharide pyruvyl transferase family protein [Vibrio crassostreae]|uniref:polysaccharide pyruvyl transferase family protein n=1 Tax=Vibrio crassostreae TaxID=246167 RepID=UPI000F4DAFEB|nr:polysaccharide pyruvyl transferase family protein [Vibrio crassostreae]RPF00121.1 polysaccharide pyruvyl transferase [Vibrio crassostreae]
MIIEVKNVQFINKGAELMLVAIKQQLEKSGLDYDLALNIGNSPYKNRVQYSAFQKVGQILYGIDSSYVTNLIPAKVRDNFGLVTHEDVDVVFDASGFAYGEQWTHRMLKHSVRQAKLMRSKGKKYIFLPQAMGPFHSDVYQKLVLEAVEYSELFYVRDQQSLEYVKSVVGESDKVILSPDFTNLVKMNNLNVKTDGERVVSIIPNSNLFSGRNRTKISESSYIKQVEDLIDYLIDESYKINILNHEGIKDEEICTKLYKKYETNSSVKLLNNLNALEVKNVIAQSFATVCARFHGCVSSLSQGVPSIGMSWSHKYEMLYRDYEVGQLLYTFEGTLKSEFQKLINNYEETSNKLLSISEIEKHKVRLMWKNVFDKIR